MAWKILTTYALCDVTTQQIGWGFQRVGSFFSTVDNIASCHYWLHQERSYSWRLFSLLPVAYTQCATSKQLTWQVRVYCVTTSKNVRRLICLFKTITPWLSTSPQLWQIEDSAILQMMKQSQCAPLKLISSYRVVRVISFWEHYWCSLRGTGAEGCSWSNSSQEWLKVFWVDNLWRGQKDTELMHQEGEQ